MLSTLLLRPNTCESGSRFRLNVARMRNNVSETFKGSTNESISWFIQKRLIFHSVSNLISISPMFSPAYWKARLRYRSRYFCPMLFIPEDTIWQHIDSTQKVPLRSGLITQCTKKQTICRYWQRCQRLYFSISVNCLFSVNQ